VVDVVELLAVGEPLELALVEILCGEEAVEHAEQHGLVVVRSGGERSTALLSHPVYGEVLRQRMPVVRAFARHAEASWRRSGSELDGCGGEFAAMNANLLAAESYQQAAEAFQRDAMRRKAAMAARRSAELREACGPVGTSLLTSTEGVVTLTRREREVASLAASGLTSRDIAERLVPIMSSG
jgi:hypothetical protein